MNELEKFEILANKCGWNIIKQDHNFVIVVHNDLPVTMEIVIDTYENMVFDLLKLTVGAFSKVISDLKELVKNK